MEARMREDARFKFYSGLLRAYTSPDGKKHLNTTASSTVKDLAGDEIRAGAIEKMSAAAVGMTMFLNHEYKVPEDVLGTVEMAKTAQRGYGDVEPIVDLDFDLAINESNPRAVQTWESIENGVKLGCSIGALIPKGGATKKKEGGFIIDDIQLLEASIVGIPANPRSWVNYASKSLRSIQFEDEAEEVEKAVELEPTEDTTSVVKDEELVTEVEPDLVEGRTKVTVTVTTDDSTGSQTASPGASENEALLDETAEGDDAAIGDTVTRAQDDEALVILDAGVDFMKALDQSTAMLRESVERNEMLSKQVSDLTRERDEANENLAMAKAIIDRIADLPIGRKAKFDGAVSEFRARFPMYDEEFVKILER